MMQVPRVQAVRHERGGNGHQKPQSPHRLQTQEVQAHHPWQQLVATTEATATDSNQLEQSAVTAKKQQQCICY